MGAQAAGSAAAMSEAQQAEVLKLLLGAAGESEEECRAGAWVGGSCIICGWLGGLVDVYG
jgi:hypothetical protein